MTAFTWLLGEPALSPFRERKLLRNLASALGLPLNTEPARNLGIGSRFAYFIESDGPLPEEELQRLCDLLHGEVSEAVPSGELFLVVPRIGTTTPWSSKATDIARGCGLSRVLRIERGVLHGITGLPGGRSALEGDGLFALHTA